MEIWHVLQQAIAVHQCPVSVTVQSSSGRVSLIIEVAVSKICLSAASDLEQVA